MEQKKQSFAFVKVEDAKEWTLIPITTNKPEIPYTVQDKWQKIVDLTARIMKVPSGLITRITQDNLEILVASHTSENPYKKNDKDSLGIGMFCETVAGRRKELLVQDIDTKGYWKNNPHKTLGMKSYMGVPIQWEDGELFGTFCMLNSEPNRFTADFFLLLHYFKEIIEADLKNILLTEELINQLSLKKIQIREIHHRIKNHYNMLINLIYLQKQNSDDEIQDLLSDIQNRIQALCLIHEKLYKNEDKQELSMDSYINQLCSIITENLTDKPVKIQMGIDKIEAPVDFTITIGLILSELISNSIKYGMPDNNDLIIQIIMKKLSSAHLSLSYRDNGPGFPDISVMESKNTMGISLIRIFTEQLQGTARFINNGGAGFETELEIPEE